LVFLSIHNIIHLSFRNFRLASLIQLYKSAYSGLSKETWFLSVVILINRSGTMVVPFMTIYASESLGFSIAQSGFIMTVFGLGAIAGTQVGGALTDKVSFYSVQVAALFGGGVMFIVLGYLTTFPLLCAGTFVLSFINEAFRPANSAAVAFYSTPLNRTRSYSLNRLAINLGWAFGGALGGFLAANNFLLLFWVDGCTNIAAAILLMIVLRMPRSVQKKIREGNEQFEKKGSSPWADKTFLYFMVLTTMFAFCFFQIFTILPLYFKQELQLHEVQIGVLMSINGILVAVIEMVLIYKLELKERPLKYIKYGVFLVGLSYAIFNILSGQFMLALLSVVIITFGEMLAMPFMNTYWINRSSNHNRGKYAGMYAMAWGIAQVTAPTVGGYVAQHFSFTTLWWGIFILSVACAMGFHWLMKRT
jgi:predicted MFS family arabinose efflux permease